MRPVISRRDGFRVQFSSCKLSGFACMCICARRRRIGKGGGRTANYLHFKMKETPHSVVKVEGGLILFFLFLRGNIKLIENRHGEKRKNPGPTILEASTEHMVCAHNESVCIFG